MNNCYLDAEAVITFFRMTGRKHIFITGSRGSGKSHLVNNMLKYMSDSFNLLQSHRTDTPQVVIKSNLVADNKEFVIGIPRTSGINPVSKGNNMTIIEDGFINCAIPAIDTHLDTTPERLFVIDELGYLESSCIPFQKAVEKLLDNSHVLAVIRKQSTEFLNRICNRKDVLVIDIDNTFETLSCIIMASGMSKRFGSNKLITDFNGRSLFENAVSISHFAGFGETLAVTRHDEVVRICEDKNIHFLRHDMPYRNEMVQLGVTRILSDNASSGNLQPQGILFLPSDQPLITRTSLQLLCLTFLYYDDKICRLSYNENAGSPCIFPAKYYDELLNLPEKKGGGFLTKKYPAQVVLVPVRDEYELYDIDTPDDITRLLKFLH